MDVDGVIVFMNLLKYLKERLISEKECSIIDSISHPTFLQNYQTKFGLTGTIEEEIEKNEINTIYNIELY